MIGAVFYSAGGTDWTAGYVLTVYWVIAKEASIPTLFIFPILSFVGFSKVFNPSCFGFVCHLVPYPQLASLLHKSVVGQQARYIE